MSEYRHGAHTVFEIHLHIVWVTKYRRAALSGDVGTRVRELIREICAQEDVIIVKGYVAKDHVHLFVSIPPQVTVSRLVQRLKGKTAYKLLQEFPHLRKKFWGRHVTQRVPGTRVFVLQQRKRDRRRHQAVHREPDR
jgi:putative transposase